MIQSTDCFHQVHQYCFHKEARVAGLNLREVHCPVCDKMIADYEVRQQLNKKDLKEIADKEMNELLKSNPMLRKCPCGNLMEVLQGDVNLHVTDEKGNEISHQAAIHMSLYRVRCAECHNNFCSECSSQPYHLGKTCDEHQRHQEVAKCIYCDEEIGKNSNHPKREDVCQAPACAVLVEVACNKKL